MITKTTDEAQFVGVEPILDIDVILEDFMFSQFENEYEISDDFMPGLGDFKFTFGVTSEGTPITLYKNLTVKEEYQSLIILAHLNITPEEIIEKLNIPQDKITWQRKKETD